MTIHKAFKDAQDFEQDEPTPLLRKTPEGAAFPLNALGPLRPVVQAVHDRVQAPVAIGAQSALSVASLAAQALGDVETLNGSAPCSVFMITIALSGERKSSCDKLLTAPVHEFQREMMDKYSEAFAAFSNRLDLWNAKRADIVKSAKKDPVTAEADLEILGPEPEPPLKPYLMAMDPTFEGLIRLFAEGRPALGLFTDEGGSFIGGHAMNSDNRVKTAAGLSKLWDGDGVNRTRSGEAAATYYGRRLACHLMVQPVVANNLLSDQMANGQGFLARFLICHPPSAIGTRDRDGHSPASDIAIAEFAAKIKRMLRQDLPLRENTRNELDPPMLALSLDARAVLVRFAREVELQQAPGEPLSRITAFASKAAEHAARIAGVLTLYAKPDAGSVSGPTMSDAIALASYYLNETLRLVDAAEVSAETANAEKLRVWLTTIWTDPLISVSDIVRIGPNIARESKKARKFLAILAAEGWVALVEGGGVVAGKHRREVWSIKGRRPS